MKGKDRDKLALLLGDLCTAQSVLIQSAEGGKFAPGDVVVRNRVQKHVVDFVEALGQGVLGLGRSCLMCKLYDLCILSERLMGDEEGLEVAALVQAREEIVDFVEARIYEASFSQPLEIGTKKLYLISSCEGCEGDDQLIVEAASEGEAINKYGLRVGIKESWFLDFVYDCRGPDGLAFQLWSDGYTDIDQPRPSPGEFKCTVSAFFGDRMDFVERYLACYGDEVVERSFPDEMLLYIWQHSEWHGTWALLLDDIARLD